MADEATPVSVSQQNAILLARIDERTKITTDDVKEIKERLQSSYVTQEEFKPVKSLVYGAVSIILMALIGAIVALVLRK